MNEFMYGGVVPNEICQDHTGLSGKSETAQHKARERKLPLSAPVSAMVLVQQMISSMSHRKGRTKCDLYLSHSLRP